MLLDEGPLVWPILPLTAPAGSDPTLWAQAVATATEQLWGLTARRFGYRSCMYRPAGLVYTAGYYDGITYLQSIYGPLWGDGWPFLGDPRVTSQTAKQVLELPAPVIADSVTEVQLTNGAGVTTILDPSKYRLDSKYLVRVDGGVWPLTQDQVANDGSANTWHVIYNRGLSVPPMGQAAAYQLAVAWLKYYVDPATCKPPMNTTSTARAGVTVQRDITKAFVTTGVEVADRWINLVNPQNLQRAPMVWSPDTRRNSTPYAGSTIPYQGP